MKLVIIESPYSGDVEANKAYLQKCIKDCLSRDEAPLASHQMYTDALDDNIAGDRRLGIDAGLEWSRAAETIIVYCDKGISEGMKSSIRYHIRCQRELEFRIIEDEGDLRTYTQWYLDEVRKFHDLASGFYRRSDDKWWEKIKSGKS